MIGGYSLIALYHLRYVISLSSLHFVYSQFSTYLPPNFPDYYIRNYTIVLYIIMSETPSPTGHYYCVIRFYHCHPYYINLT